jgi:hypothetical protein
MSPRTPGGTPARPARDTAGRIDLRRPVGWWRGRRSRGAIAAALALLAAIALAGCGSSFDPSGPCTTDGSAAHAYPDLEATVPTSYKGSAPSEVDSGRACTSSGLGTLAGHGVKEIRFAGATWSTGTDSGLSLAVFTTPDGSALDPAWMAEFYETGARNGKNVTSVETSAYAVSPTIGASRLDVLNGESYQSVVVWERNGKVAVAVVADFIREIQTKDAHDAVVRAAVDAFAG